MEPADAAGLLIGMVGGYASLAKNAQDPKVTKAGIGNMVGELRSLRAGQPQARLIASVSQGTFGNVTYQTIRMLGQSAARSGQALQTTS